MTSIIRILYIIVIINISSLIIYAQPTLEWARRYNGSANAADEAFAVAIDRLGNVFVTGTSTSTETGYDYCTIKYSSTGDSMWVRRYGNSNMGGANDMTVDSTGNIIITGGLTIKYTNSGNLLWAAQNNGGCVRLRVDNSQNIYAAGNGYDNYLTNKFDNNGNLLWHHTYNGPGNQTDRLNDMTIDPFGNIVVTGWSWGGVQNDYDMCTIKYNSQGDSSWVKRFNGPVASSPDYAYALTADITGNIYVSGVSKDIDNIYKILIFKLDTSGDTLWMRRYNVAGWGGGGRAISVDKLGNVFIAGISSYDYIILKYSNTGILLAITTLPGTFAPPDPKIVLDSNNNIYIATSKDISTSQIALIITKYDNSLNQLWTYQFTGGISGGYTYAATGLCFDNSGKLCISGISYIDGTGTSYDYLTLKISQTVGIIKNQNKIPGQFKLYQNYPNPFNPETKINFDLPKSSFIKMSIYDGLGRKIEQLINENLSAGNFTIGWNANNYASGIYYCTLQSENSTQAIKLLLIK